MGTITRLTVNKAQAPQQDYQTGIRVGPEVDQTLHKHATAENKVHKTILIPLDGSELAESVLPRVLAFVEHEDAKLVDVVLIRVCEPPVVCADYPEACMPYTWEEHEEHERVRAKRIGERYLAKVKKRFNDTGLNVRSKVLLGDPAEEIVNFANRNDCNLIAMATHQHFRFIRWLYRSAADNILKQVKCSVLLVNE